MRKIFLGEVTPTEAIQICAWLSKGYSEKSVSVIFDLDPKIIKNVHTLFRETQHKLSD